MFLPTTTRWQVLLNVSDIDTSIAMCPQITKHFVKCVVFAVTTEQDNKHRHIYTWQWRELVNSFQTTSLWPVHVIWHHQTFNFYCSEYRHAKYDNMIYRWCNAVVICNTKLLKTMTDLSNQITIQYKHYLH